MIYFNAPARITSFSHSAAELKVCRAAVSKRVALHLQKSVLELCPKKFQIDITTEAGFPDPNMIALRQSGASKLPLDQVIVTSKMNDVDRRAWLADAWAQPPNPPISRCPNVSSGIDASRSAAKTA